MKPIWDKSSRFASSEGTVFKYVFTKPGAIAEAVLYRYPTFQERTVLCISTQSGCPVGCTFCGTGRQFVRSLTVDEILSQVDYALSDHRIVASEIEKFQIMFMSMGEPLLNWIAVEAAIRKLYRAFPYADLLLSTMGPQVDYEPLMKLSFCLPRVGLQFSIHESTDEKRDALIPFKKKHTLKSIAEIGDEWHQRTGRYPFFNYCAHEGNSTKADAKRLKALFPPYIWNATVSVICEKNESVKASHERQRESASNFSGLLLDQGYNVRVFDPAGQDDIGGGCGQLWYVQQWLKERKEKAALKACGVEVGE